MINNRKHLAILIEYKDHIEENKDNVKGTQVWLLGVIGCLKMAVYTGEVKNTELIAETNSFITHYQKLLVEDPENPEKTYKYFKEASGLIDKIIESYGTD